MDATEVEEGPAKVTVDVPLMTMVLVCVGVLLVLMTRTLRKTTLPSRSKMRIKRRMHQHLPPLFRFLSV